MTTSLGKRFPATLKLMCFLLRFVRFIINLTSAFWKDMYPKSYPWKGMYSMYSALHEGDKNSSVVRTLLALLISLHYCWLLIPLREIHLVSLCLSFSSVGFLEELPSLCQKMIHNKNEALQTLPKEGDANMKSFKSNSAVKYTHYHLPRSVGPVAHHCHCKQSSELGEAFLAKGDNPYLCLHSQHKQWLS